MEFFRQLFGNYALNVALISLLAAQLLKVVSILVKYKRFDFKKMLEAGGMPSSHSALVVALTVALAKTCGLTSPEYAIAFCFSIVVMFDASGVRRAAGEQAKILNYMLEHWGETTPEMFEKELKEILGHTPIEVFAGAAVGLATGFICWAVW